MWFAAWVHMVPTMHASRVREFHCAWCSAPCFRWGDHISRDCMIVSAAALMGFRGVVRAVVQEGCSVHCTDTMGARMYDRCSAVKRWRVVRDEDVPVKAKSAAWNVAVTWSP